MAKRDRYKEYARDKAIARVTGLKKALQETRWNENSRLNIEARINLLEKNIFESRTYADGKRIAGHTKESTLAAAKMLETLVQETPIQRQLKKQIEFSEPSYAQRNKIFQTMMNIVSENETMQVTIGKKTFQMTDTMVRMFYRAYQDLWNTGNVSIEDRNAEILSKGKFRTLEEAFAVAMGTNNNYKRSKIIERVKAGDKISDEDAAELYKMLSEGENNKSYKAGSIATNTKIMRTSATQTSSGLFEYQLVLSEEEKLRALKNFLGEDFEYSQLYSDYDSED